MKITDYGIWFRIYSSTNTWFKEPDQSQYKRYVICLNGMDIGSFWYGCKTYISPLNITLLGLKLRRSLPAFLSEGVWKLPKDYVPTESDFEEVE